MITVFVNEAGYYVAGDGVEITQRCSPATTTEGDSIFQPLHHTYKILYLALQELGNRQVMEDVMVYNDSRIIDEVNGIAGPLDNICEKWLNAIRRHAIPNIRTVVFFRKKNSQYIKETIDASHKQMLPAINQQAKQKLLKDQSHKTITRKRELINRLKKAWFGDNNGIR